LVDVLEGYVSAEAAERQYGVVLMAGATAVDEVATSALRASRSNGHIAHATEGETK
jgi:N-methylhydantoinase B